MSAGGTLAEAWAQAESFTVAASVANSTTQPRRTYMRGALDALLLLKGGATVEQLLDECVQFGRAVGTAAERAN
jgi:hypothetical protein